MKNERKIFSLYIDPYHPNVHLREPIAEDDYVFAANSNYLIKIAKSALEDTYEVNEEAPSIKDFFPARSDSRTVKLSELKALIDKLPILEYDLCEECDGSGTVMWEYYHWKKDFDCPKCKGSGYGYEAIYPKPDYRKTVNISGLFFKGEHVKVLIETLKLMSLDKVTMCFDSNKQFEQLVHFYLNDVTKVLIPSLYDEDK